MVANPTAIANLLRLARAECHATVAFAVMTRNGGQPEMLRVPPLETTGTPPDAVLAEIVTRASFDPEFGRTRAFVRTVQLPSATLLAVAPVQGAGPSGMVGVLGQDPGGFAPAKLELLDRLSERLARHVRALHDVERAAPLPAPTPPFEAAAGQAQQSGKTEEAVLDALPEVVQEGAPEEPRTGAGEHQAAVPAATAVPPPARATSGVEGAGPAPLAFAGFGDEPAGVIAPLPADHSHLESTHRQPLGPLTLSSTGGFLLGSQGLALGQEARAGGTPPGGPAPAHVPPGPSVSPGPPAPGAWWAASDAVTGLPSVGQFFSRAGRLLGSEARATGAVALVLVEVPEERTAQAAARALAAQLRFSDPLARVDRDLFAAAVLLFPGSMRGDAVEERLGSAVRSALDWLAPVRTTHVLAEPGDRRDVDELLRQAMTGLPGRTMAGSLQ